MSEKYLSLSEAQAYTGKTRNRMRRFVESITKPESHPDRCFIEPSQETVAEYHKNRHPFSWKVSTALLDREFKQEGTIGSQNAAQTVPAPAIELLEKTIGMLQEELKEKNQQIAQFQERDRETNILLQQTTEKLVMLTEGNKPSTSSAAVTVDSDRKPRGDDFDGSNKTKPVTLWELATTPLRFRKKRYN